MNSSNRTFPLNQAGHAATVAMLGGHYKPRGKPDPAQTKWPKPKGTSRRIR